MRIIKAERIKDTVSRLCQEANQSLRKDVLAALKSAYRRENSKRSKDALNAIIQNAKIAKQKKLAICQDTGLPCVFVELGQGAVVKGSLNDVIIKGVEQGYKTGYFRESVVAKPLARGRSSYRGVIIHTNIVNGNKLRIQFLPKGFGCENKSQLKMFKPTTKIEEVKKFIIEAVKAAGPDACPPYVVGVGIGGTADYAGLLAKKALLRRIGGKSSKLEKQLLAQINKLNIGPMGLGGKTTALAVNVETYPTHIAGLPVAVNLSCHALRSAAATI